MKIGGKLITRVCFVFGLFLGWTGSILGQGSAIHIGTVETDGGRKVYRVDFGRTDAKLAQYAKAAFRLHGAYRMVRVGEGDFGFEFRAVGDGLVELEIFTDKPRRSRLRKVFRGGSNTDALLRACDEAVHATTGLPGFFSGKLVYLSKRGSSKELYVADTLFLRASQKTNHKAICINPSWSADGQGIFYTSDKSKFNDIYFMDLAARKIRRVAAFKGSNLRGVQNPVGTSVAYILSGTGNPELWLADGIGAKPRRITRNNSNESGPCWSPDGKRMIVTSDSAGKPQLYEVSLKTGRLVPIPTNVSRHCTEATWNPRNPRRIAFTAAVGGGFQVVEYDFLLRRSRKLTAGSGDALQPEWASDGRHLFFTQRIGATTRLMILDAGSDEEASARNPLPLVDPVRLHDNRFGNCSQANFFYK